MKKELTLYWEGKVSYGFSYWVWLTLIGGIISIPAFLPDAYYDAYLIPMFLYLAFLFVVKIFLIVGTWRSAEKYKMQKQKKKLSAFWAYAGQASIILSIISTAAELI
jgi:hypothetical protein